MGSAVNIRGRNLSVPVFGGERGSLSDRCFLKLLLLHLSAPQGALT